MNDFVNTTSVIQEDVLSLRTENKALKELCTKLEKQNKGLKQLLEGIESVISVDKKKKDMEITLYWIEQNAIRVFKEENRKIFLLIG